VQAKFKTACLECHDAGIIAQQRLSKAAWTREVDKMIKWGATVNSSDREALVDYFSANFGPDNPAYVAKRSARNHGPFSAAIRRFSPASLARSPSRDRNPVP